MKHPHPHPHPRVTVVVPAWNAAAYLSQALDSALAQDFDSYEIVIVDDGATDATGAIADRYAARHPGRIRVIHQSNAGLPAARNAAIAVAQGELIALLDADDEWLPDHLQRAVAAFDEDPSLGLVHANIERIDANGETIERCIRTWHRQDDPFAALALRHEHVSCPTAVFRRRCLDVVGAFDLQFTGLGCEDRDLWLRIVERYPIRYIDRITARYRMHGSNMSRNRAKMEAARQRLLEKLRRSARGAPLARHIAAMIQSDLGYELQLDRQFGPALRAQLRALRTRPATLLVWRRGLGLLRAWLQAVLGPGLLLGNRS